MTEDQFERYIEAMKSEINRSVAVGIELNVNGKIRNIDRKLDEYISDDNEWKKMAQPVVNMGNQARGASVVILWVAGAIIALGGAFEIVHSMYKLFKS